MAIYDHLQLVESGDAPQALCRRSFFRVNIYLPTWAAAASLMLNTVEIAGRLESCETCGKVCCCNPFLLDLGSRIAQASQVRLRWAAGGGGLLAETSSDSDATNKSYYGETKLQFLSVRAARMLVPSSTCLAANSLRLLARAYDSVSSCVCYYKITLIRSSI